MCMGVKFCQHVCMYGWMYLTTKYDRHCWMDSIPFPRSCTFHSSLSIILQYELFPLPIPCCSDRQGKEMPLLAKPTYTFPSQMPHSEEDAATSFGSQRMRWTPKYAPILLPHSSPRVPSRESCTTLRLHSWIWDGRTYRSQQPTCPAADGELPLPHHHISHFRDECVTALIFSSTVIPSSSPKNPIKNRPKTLSLVS